MGGAPGFGRQTSRERILLAAARVGQHVFAQRVLANCGRRCVFCGLSPSAFAHLFRDVTGRSPYQFVKEMRLDRARELLLDGQYTVARISKEVGYASVSHFISEFRGRFGVTPRAYYEAQAVGRELTRAGMGNSSAGSRYNRP